MQKWMLTQKVQSQASGRMMDRSSMPMRELWMLKDQTRHWAWAWAAWVCRGSVEVLLSSSSLAYLLSEQGAWVPAWELKAMVDNAVVSQEDAAEMAEKVGT